VIFEVVETVPGQYFQRHFFNKKEEEQEAWNSLIERLCEKLGRSCVRGQEPAFVAEPVENYKPENGWRRRVVENQKSLLLGVDLPLPERPLRLLPKPTPLAKNGNSLVGRDREWEISDWEGPERISGEWWGEEFRRDYFRVGTKNGEQLWIFRIPEAAGDYVYLHGYFD
jgi:protein ImuB